MTPLDDIHIEPPSFEAGEAVRKKWDHIAKPLDGMGKFEKFHSRIGAIQHTMHPDLAGSGVIVFCADNGIVEEGVSQSDQSVTRSCAVNLGQNRTAVGVMAEAAGVKVFPVDIGIALPAGCRERCCYKEEDHIPGVLNRKVSFGTKNFLKEPAMTREDALRAIETGIELVHELKDRGMTALGIGELGIGNTTTSACVTSALLGCDPSQIVGRGAGLSDQGLMRKNDVVKTALEKWGFLSEKKIDRNTTDTVVNNRERNVCSGRSGTIEILRTVGGLDIAGMAGACIGGAIYHVPIILDGVISMTAALTAERLVPGVKSFLIPSHMSREPAAAMTAKELGLSPVLDADMALGEGTGAVMMLSLLKLADCVYRNCVPFEKSGVEQYRRYNHLLQQ